MPHPFVHRFRLSRLLPAREGNIGTLAALTFPLMVFSTALGVDYGYLTLQQRRLQASADLAAIAAAARISTAEEAVARHFADNGEPVSVLRPGGGVIPPESVPGGLTDTATAYVERGRYIADPAIDPADRFTPAGADADAARVNLSRRADLFIATFFNAEPPMLAATGVAARQKVAAFSVGTRLASLNAGLLNALLGEMLGTTLSLNLMDYRALIDADIAVHPFLKAVAADLDLTAATYDEVLAADLTVPQLAGVMRGVTGLSGPVRSALRAIEQATAGSRTTFPLSHLLNIDPKRGLAITSGGDWAMSVNVLQIISAAAGLANGSEQISLDVGAFLPGIATTTIRLAIGEPPVETPAHRLGAPGSAVRSAQTRLSVEAGIDGLSLLAGLRIKLPLYIEVAASEARLADIRCLGGSPHNAGVSIDAVPGLAEIAIGKVDPSVLSDFSSEARVKKARIVDSLLLSIDAIAHVEAKNMTRSRISFTPTEISAGAVKTVSTRHALTSVTRTLLDNLDLDVNVLILTLGTPKAVTSALAATLGSVTPALDELVYNLLLVVGVRIGEADIRVTGAECRRPALVQ
ncbi:hypothetical protein KYK29_01640 [Shinella daejeonensis]|uniref:pilus assembly protein TadG-related protein n=1 Tax=Shinella daejeonensis TaxID=659017 RepID=UPI0020C77F12|nr:pilus assembly protein TadG-related protein [Shinella daejeonensis]MCP8893614.1 hypothetical protein [Shinella daejeonensis]